MMKLQTARRWTTALLLLASTWLAAAGDWQGIQQAALDAYQQQDYARAEQLLRQAIRIAEQADNGTAYKAGSLSLLAYVQMAKGETDSALHTQAEALALSHRVTGGNSPSYAALLFNQGDLLEQAGKMEQALGAYREALQLHARLNQTGEPLLKTAGRWHSYSWRCSGPLRRSIPCVRSSIPRRRITSPRRGAS